MSFQNKWRQFRYWLSALSIWLLEACYVLTAFLVVLIALLIIWFSGSDEAAIRWTGMVLQLLGVLTVILGIEQTRKFFGRPSTRASLQQWLKRFPTLRGRTHPAGIDASRPRKSISMRGNVLTRTEPDNGIKSRVEILERNIERLYERINMTESELDSRLRVQKQDLEREKSTRESKDKEVLAKLEATEMGSINISAAGTIWLFVGVILSSISKELSNWFG